MPSMMRLMRTRLPTYLSTGLGALVDISNTPWDHVRGARQNERRICLRRRYCQILLGGSGGECRQVEQRTDWIWFRAAECELHSRSVNWWILSRQIIIQAATKTKHEDVRFQ